MDNGPKRIPTGRNLRLGVYFSPSASENTYIIIYGGKVDPSDLGHLGAGKFTGEIYGLDTETLVWKKWEDGPGSENHPGPGGWCAFGKGWRDGQEGLLVYGGNSPTNDRLDDISFFTPLK
ncbi:hypothetical protein SLA2020_024620 [Shorea laevis]